MRRDARRSLRRPRARGDRRWRRSCSSRRSRSGRRISTSPSRRPPSRSSCSAPHAAGGSGRSRAASIRPVRAARGSRRSDSLRSRCSCSRSPPCSSRARAGTPALERFANWHMLAAAALYFPWALLQQYIFQFYWFGRWLQVVPVPVAVALTAVAFAAVHFPRWPVMAVTLVAGAAWALIYYGGGAYCRSRCRTRCSARRCTTGCSATTCSNVGCRRAGCRTPGLCARRAPCSSNSPSSDTRWEVAHHE